MRFSVIFIPSILYSYMYIHIPFIYKHNPCFYIKIQIMISVPFSIGFECTHSVRKPDEIFAYAKTKTQISCAVTAQLISAFVFATPIVSFLLYLYPKFQDSIFCGCTGWFVSDLVRNLKDRFSRVASHI